MKLKIEINLDNLAFEERLSDEIVTILESIRMRLECFAVMELDKAPLFDSSGEKCGMVKLVKKSK